MLQQETWRQRRAIGVRYQFAVFMTAVALTICACAAEGLVGGSEQRAGPELTAASVFQGIVTDPAPSSTAGIVMSPATEAEVVYVSLPRGLVPTATSATLMNYRTSGTVATAMVDGGFDPVAIGAQVADTIIITFQLLGGGMRQTWAVVPSARQPVAVRIDPPSGARDVRPDAGILIVFSEPVDPASLITSALTLRPEGTPVPGTIEVLPGTSWVARFTPAAQLTMDATYELIGTDQVRDLDGDALEAPARVSFTTAAVTDPPSAGRLAFSSWNGSDVLIYTINPDGSELTTVAPGMDPSFSPDGKRIAFWRYQSGSAGIYVANADGSGVATAIAEGYQPTWSPDGRRLAYGCGGICFINVDGTGRTRVTPSALASANSDPCIRDSDPTWSPNGSTIAFTHWPDARIPTSMCLSLGVAISFPFDFWTEVWLIEADGSNLRPLRDAAGSILTYAGWPSWSPDGKRLAFFSASSTDEHIDVADADGSAIVTVMRQNPPRWDYAVGSPDWSPDGRRILFSTTDGWGFADASRSGAADYVKSPPNVVPNTLSWSWSRR